MPVIKYGTNVDCTLFETLHLIYEIKLKLAQLYR